MKTVKAIVGIAFVAAVALGDTHSASVNVTVDTRTTAVTSLTITGPATVSGGNTATYICTARYADGSQGDVSSLCTWSFVSAAPGGMYLYGPQLQTAQSSLPSQSVQIRATYKRPDGQWASAPFTVSITGGFLKTTIENVSVSTVALGAWDLNASANITGASGTIQSKWYLDGVLLPGSSLSNYRVTGADGSRNLRLQVTEQVLDQTRVVTNQVTVTFNKPPVAKEAVMRYPVPDPANGDILDTAGNQYEQYHDWKTLKTNGLVVLTHGYRDSGTKDWIQTMGIYIESRLQLSGCSVPNICIYDWSSVSQPAQVVQDSAENFKRRSWLHRLNPMAMLLSTETLKFITGLMAIHPVACDQGQNLATWIKGQVVAGNIDSNAPIHLIGHSAGGFVVSECAFQLKDKSIISGEIQYTTLDTPTIGLTDVKWFSLSTSAGSSCRMERYDVGNGFGVLFLPFDKPVAGSGYNRRVVSPESFFTSPLDAHAYAYDWYNRTATVNPPEYDGFYYSPFMDNGFHGVTFTQPAQASTARSFAADMLVSMDSAIPDSPLTNFEMFGSVTLSNELYKVTEEANAGLFKDIALPVGAQLVKFNYRFATAGDGDYLVVYWGTNGTPLYIGSDLQLSGAGFMEGEAAVNIFAGETNKLTFMLVSRGEANAVLELKDIAMTLSDDPDYDGLTTDEETALGTDPLNSDTDGDGLSDFDEVRTYFTDPLLADSDGDGMSDFNEIQAGTNPNDPNSCFIVTSLTPLPAGGMLVTWQGKSGRHYRVNRCDRLGTGVYTTLATGITGVEPHTSFNDTQGSSSAFYWVEQEE